MKIITDIYKFKDLVDPVIHMEFADVDIEADTPLGIFRPSRLTEIIEYCKVNPQYHIISYIAPGPVVVNYLRENAYFYRLAIGAKDREIIFVAPTSPEGRLKALTMEFDSDQ